jgi:DNA (cytosine-5)-methyltransferase 1
VKPRLLDLFCGGGGAAMGYQRAGFEVVGVDLQPQPNYPFPFFRSDAIAYLNGMWDDMQRGRRLQFAAIHASPPCQAHTRKAANWGRKRNHWIDHPTLIEPTRELLRATGLPYVIENVPGAPINAQIELCGTHFGLRIIKHRLFEANWPLPMPPASCDHRGVYNPWVGPGRSAEKLREAQGIDWLPISGGASRKAGYTGDLFNAIPPAYTEHIGRAWIERLQHDPSVDCPHCRRMMQGLSPERRREILDALDGPVPAPTKKPPNTHPDLSKHQPKRSRGKEKGIYGAFPAYDKTVTDPAMEKAILDEYVAEGEDPAA